MTGTPTVSVVIPTYERRDWLPRILRPLLSQPAAHEVVVVVDGARDGSLELLEEMARSDERLKPVFIENRGEGGAREAGVERATGEVMLLLDDDVEAEPGLVEGHARRHAGRDDLVVVGYMPPVLGASANGDRDAFTARLYGEAYEGRCAQYEADPDGVLLALWAGNISLRRDQCLRVGLSSREFTERYHPDREFGLRCREAGLTGLFDRSLRARHHYRRTLDQFIRDSRSQGAAGTLIHRLHPELAGELPEDRFRRRLPPPAAALVDLCRRPRAAAVTAASLRRLVQAGDALHAEPLKVNAARLLRRVEQQRGAIEFQRGRR